jgi:hypothetical protein
MIRGSKVEAALPAAGGSSGAAGCVQKTEERSEEAEGEKGKTPFYYTEIYSTKISVPLPSTFKSIKIMNISKEMFIEIHLVS